MSNPDDEVEQLLRRTRETRERCNNRMALIGKFVIQPCPNTAFIELLEAIGKTVYNFLFQEGFFMAFTFLILKNQNHLLHFILKVIC